MDELALTIKYNQDNLFFSLKNLIKSLRMCSSIDVSLDDFFDLKCLINFLSLAVFKYFFIRR